MVRLIINGMPYEVEEKYLRPVQPVEVYDAEYSEEEVKEEE